MTKPSALSLDSALRDGLAPADERAALDERLRRNADMILLPRLEGAAVVLRDGSKEVPRTSAVGISSSNPSLASYSGSSDPGDAGGDIGGGVFPEIECWAD